MLESDEILSRTLVSYLEKLIFGRCDRFLSFNFYAQPAGDICNDALFLTSTFSNLRSKINLLVSIIRTDPEKIYPKRLKCGKKSIRPFI
ncbi:MAG TPA: hypothetical protein DCM07_20955 [Planctomycetaceae bacterium]|nr:hypothetical protein [Gimesia sp.]HAH47278.1 hypothetical protein [Planctomycetaceae bacterium]HBL42906.1 hypothetical protein [Planctomycetaceae bacterium]